MQPSGASAQLRAFVAVELPARARRTAASMQDELRDGRARIRWVEPRNLHVTLKFLGDVEECRLASLAESLRGALAGLPACPLTVEGIGAFPNARRPRVIWAGIREQGPFRALWQRTEEAAAALGFDRERRPHTTHVTLGRVKRPADLSRALSSPKLAACHSETEYVSAVTVFRSELTPSGAVYSVLYQVQLGNAELSRSH